MRPSLTSSVWTWAPTALAALFVGWSLYLVTLVSAEKREIERRGALVSSLNDLAASIGELGLSRTKENVKHEDTFAAYQRRLQAVEKFEDDLKEIRPELDRTRDAVARAMTAMPPTKPSESHFKLFGPAEATFWKEITTAQAAIGDAVRTERAKLAVVCHRVADTWRQLNVLVFIACLLAGVVAWMLRVYRAELIKRRQTTEKLEESERFISRITEATPNLIYVFDVVTRRNVYINRQVTPVLGFSVEQFQALGEQCLPVLLHSDDLARIPERLARWDTAKDGDIIETEYRMRDAEGQWRWFISHEAVFLRNEDGRVRQIVGTATDISERKRLEEQYLHAQKMEAVGQLAGGVAHDFNNLLTVINGYCDLILGGDSENPWRDFVKEVQRAGTRATSLTRQLLAFGRRQMLQPIVLDLNTIVADTEKMLRRLIGADIDLSTCLAAELRTVRADPGQIDQVLVNLAVNARDAMPRGGKLTITSANVDLQRDPERPEIRPGPYVRLTVSDTGCGIDPVVLARIFEPFFTTKEIGKGTGLGLATVYGIVKQSGGYIYVDSEVGKGTTFTIYLPAVTEKAPNADTEPVEKDWERGHETVLLVEDEDGVRKLARELLEKQGYTVLEARHGGEALTLSREHSGTIDLLLTDMVMPIIDGAELVKRLRRDRPDIKALYMSGYTDSALARRRATTEDIMLIAKPFQLDKLARTVREVLNQNGCPTAI